ncbi:MAG: HAMP domain-containing sensor histidine kinase [Pseudomonadota bacterium]
MHSLNRDLLKWTLGTLCLGSLLLVGVAYMFTLAEMNEVLDENLREVATSVAEYHSGARVQPLPGVRAEQPHDYGDLVTRVWRTDGTPLFTSNARVPIPFSPTTGAGAVTVAGMEWRTFTLLQGDVVVQAAQRTLARRQMAGESASKLLLPLLLLTALIGVLLAMALRRGLRPLEGATAHIARRTAATLVPMQDVEVPRELLPLVNAFNGLMERLASAFAMQRRFVADAAHELRTPVTALHLQMQLLERAPDEAARTEAMGELRAGMLRMERLVEQLLQLSRSQPEVEGLRREAVALDALVRSVVGDFSKLAEHRGIDLGACAGECVDVVGDEDQLRSLLNNLVRNALYYCPRGSRVDVTAARRGGHAVLEVADDGPGIAPAERDRVFDRFYRGPQREIRDSDPAGSGLGLAIVRSIAERHGATVSLGEEDPSGGLRVEVAFPSGLA